MDAKGTCLGEDKQVQARGDYQQGHKLCGIKLVYCHGLFYPCGANMDAKGNCLSVDKQAQAVAIIKRAYAVLDHIHNFSWPFLPPNLAVE